MSTTTVGGTPRILDWIPRFDPESLNYKIATQTKAAGIPVRAPRNKRWTRGAWLDQGQEGACVGFSFATLVAATPKAWPHITNATGESFYSLAQDNDEWPGKAYSGSSVLGMMQGAKKEGDLQAYWWATTLEEIDTGLSYYGPMQFGVPWMTGCFTPDSDGFLKPTGQVEGGHAICVASRETWQGRVRYRIDNTWGKGWGINGSAYADVELLQFWLSHQSEFALPKKAKR